jgi:hypothetical protein
VRKNNEIKTDEWVLYQRGVDYKNRIGLYQTAQDNNKFYQGDQWEGVESEGLPTPVFNIIKPVIRHKASAIMQNDVKIVYSCGNATAPNYAELEQFADILTKYAAVMWERLKMDFLNENVLKDAAIQGDGVCHFYWDDEDNNIKAELIDNTNIYVSNQNYADIEEQEYIIISYRRNVSKVRKEAEKYGVKDVDLIVADTDTQEQAGEWVELQDEGMCIVLLKYWKEKGRVHFRKSTRSVVLVEDEDTLLKRYPIAFFNWETVKNSFHGVSDVTGLIPNQKYVNTIAALIQFSTMHTAFPKMVYNSLLIDNPDNAVGVAIGVNGAENVKNMIDYIIPPAISTDAFKMFDTTIKLTQEMMGAGEGALGNINPEKASGRAILAIIEQSAIPLESIRRRFFNYIEDIALIWADMWQVHSQDGLQVAFAGDDNSLQTAVIPQEVFDELMLETRIDVGPSTRWTERALIETLDNLLMNKFIPFDWYVELIPEGAGLPKAKLKELIEQAQQAQQPPGMTEQDIDSLLDSLPPEIQQQALQNPQILEDIIAQQLQAFL